MEWFSCLSDKPELLKSREVIVLQNQTVIQECKVTNRKKKQLRWRRGNHPRKKNSHNHGKIGFLKRSSLKENTQHQGTINGKTDTEGMISGTRRRFKQKKDRRKV